MQLININLCGLGVLFASLRLKTARGDAGADFNAKEAKVDAKNAKFLLGSVEP